MPAAPAAGAPALHQRWDGPPRHLRRTFTEGTNIAVDVTPDGQSIVFDLLGQIFIMPSGGGAARRLTGPSEFAYLPRVSPDGQAIAFISDRDGTANLWTMALAGSNARPVTHHDATAQPVAVAYYNGLRWAPDGRSLFATAMRAFGKENDLTKGRLHRIDLATGTAVEALDGAATGRVPAFAGTDMFFSLPVADDLFVMSTWQERHPPLYQIARRTAATGQISLVTSLPEGAFSPAVSPDGRWLLYWTRFGPDTGVRARDLTTGTERWLVFPVDQDLQFGRQLADLVPAVGFMPDSRSVIMAFGGRIHRVDITDGTSSVIPFSAEVDRLLQPPVRFGQRTGQATAVKSRAIGSYSLDKDGRRAAFQALRKIWLTRLGDGGARRLTQVDLGSESYPVIHGEHVYFTAFKSREGGHVYRIRIDGRELERLTSIAGAYSNLAVASDGRRVAAVRSPLTAETLLEAPAGSEIVGLDPEQPGPMRTLAPIDANPFAGTPSLQFSADGSRLYFLEPEHGLKSIPVEGGAAALHLAFKDLGPSTLTGNPLVSAVRLDATETQALVQVQADMDFGQLYHVDLSQAGAGNPQTVSITKPIASLPVRRLTDSKGGLQPTFASDGSVVYTIGRYLVRATPGGRTLAEHELSAIAEPARTSGLVAYRHARVFTMGPQGIIDDGTVVVDGNRLVAVGREGEVRIPAAARTVDLRGRSLVPGLVDSHCHIGWGLGDPAFDGAQNWKAASSFAFGTTTCFDPAGPANGALLELADLIEAGEVVGPRVFTTNGVTQGGHWVKGPSDADALVTRFRRYFDTPFLKMYGFGPRRQRQWLIEAARRQRVTVYLETETPEFNLANVLDGSSLVGHGLAWTQYSRADLRGLLTAAGAAHGFQFLSASSPRPTIRFSAVRHFPDLVCDAKVRRFIPSSIIDGYTLASYSPSEANQIHAAVAAGLKRQLDDGVLVALGSHGEWGGFGMQLELWGARSGMDFVSALRLATINAAAAIGYERDIGSIEPGKLADMLVVEGDPRAVPPDRLPLRGIERIIKDGAEYDAGTLDRLWPVLETAAPRWFNDPSTPAYPPGARPLGLVDLTQPMTPGEPCPRIRP